MIKIALVIMIVDYRRFNTYELLTISDVLSLWDGGLLLHRSALLKDMRRKYLHLSGWH